MHSSNTSIATGSESDENFTSDESYMLNSDSDESDDSESDEGSRLNSESDEGSLHSDLFIFDIEPDDASMSPPFTDCLVLISHAKNINVYTLYDSVCDRYIIRGKNTEMDTEFSFNCDTKASSLFFLKTVFEGMFFDETTAHTLTNFTSLFEDCNKISYDELYYTKDCGHICVISKVTTKTLKLLKNIYNSY